MLTSTSLNFLTYYHSNSPCCTCAVLALNNLAHLQCGSSLFSTATLNPTSVPLRINLISAKPHQSIVSLFGLSHPTTSSSTNICFVQNYQLEEANTCPTQPFIQSFFLGVLIHQLNNVDFFQNVFTRKHFVKFLITHSRSLHLYLHPKSPSPFLLTSLITSYQVSKISMKFSKYIIA